MQQRTEFEQMCLILKVVEFCMWKDALRQNSVNGPRRGCVWEEILKSMVRILQEKHTIQFGNRLIISSRPKKIMKYFDQVGRSRDLPDGY
jgi:hypothetical protein